MVGVTRYELPLENDIDPVPYLTTLVLICALPTVSRSLIVVLSKIPPLVAFVNN